MHLRSLSLALLLLGAAAPNGHVSGPVQFTLAPDLSRGALTGLQVQVRFRADVTGICGRVAGWHEDPRQNGGRAGQRAGALCLVGRGQGATAYNSVSAARTGTGHGAAGPHHARAKPRMPTHLGRLIGYKAGSNSSLMPIISPSTSRTSASSRVLFSIGDAV